jgi:hypothetical protein
MKYIIDTTEKNIIGPLSDLSKPAASFSFPISTLSERGMQLAEFETGLLANSDSGLISYRTSHGYEQLIIQLAPGINSVKWGQCENDPNAKIFSLAMPYKIIIADFENNGFLGMRHFFTMTPAFGWDTQLYATGFSNTNNVGYHVTSIGWVCIYLHGKPVFKNLSEKIDYVVNRESGLAEPYNYRNMSHTDGPFFYKQLMPSKNHFHNADNWHKKTQKEGLSWVLDKDNYIPYTTIISDQFYAQKYVSKTENPKAVDYTLYHAAYENYAPYYDHNNIKPFNRKDKNDLTSETISSFFSKNRTPFDYSPEAAKPSTKKPSPPTLSATALKTKNKLSNKSCPGCHKPYPVTEPFINVATKVVANPVNLLDGTPAIVPMVVQEKTYCSNCASYLGHNMLDVVNGKNLLVAKSILLHFGNEWYYHWELISCPSCEKYYPKKTSKDYLVYGPDLISPTRCYNCLPSKAIELDSITSKLIAVEYSTSALLLSIEQDTKTLHPKVVLKDEIIHTSHLNHICHCGMYNKDTSQLVPTEKDNKKVLVCKTCTHQNLIDITEPVQIAINVKGNQ